MAAARAASLLVLAVAVVGCGTGLLPGVRGSGVVVEARPEVGGFSGLEVGSGIDATLEVGTDPGLLLRADDNVIDSITATTVDGRLVLDVDGNVRDATLQARITVPADALTDVALTGSATLTGIEPLTSSSLDVAVEGASRAVVVVDTSALAVEATGAGVLNASGAAEDLAVDAAGAASVRLDQLTSASATVTAEESSSVLVRVTGRLDVAASGSAIVRYSGDPDIGQRSASDESSVEPA